MRPSPLASRRSAARPFFCSIRASIRSSTVPRQTNLWTSDVPPLPDPEGPVGRLVLDGGVPPAVEVDHLGRGRQVEPRAARPEGQHEERDRLVGLEALDERHALLHRRLAVEHEAGPAEEPGEVLRERPGHLAELGEHERLLLPRGELLDQLGQPRELAAVLRRAAAVAEPLGRMVADLLEAQQGGEDRAAPLDALRRAQAALELLHRLLVERGLLPGQAAERAHLGLVRQVGDDAAIGLEAAQDVRLDERPERPVVAVAAGGHLPGGAREGARAPQEPGIQEVEQRPEVAEPVLDRGARQGDPGAAAELLDRARLPGPGVLDRLGLVEDDQRPGGLAEPREPRHLAVRRDDEIGPGQLVRGERRELATRPLRRVRDDHVQVGREALDLREPVGDQGGRHHQEAGGAGRRAASIRAALPARPSAEGAGPSTWIVLPSPMSSARQAPRPRRERNQSQRTPISW